MSRSYGFGLASGIHRPAPVHLSDVLLAAHNSLRAHGPARIALRSMVADAAWLPALARLTRPRERERGRLGSSARRHVLGRRQPVHPHTWSTGPASSARARRTGCACPGERSPNLELRMERSQAASRFPGSQLYRAERFEPPRWASGACRAPAIPSGVDPVTILARRAVLWASILPRALRLAVRMTENACQPRSALSRRLCPRPGTIDYVHRNSLELRRAMGEGARVDGYLAWCCSTTSNGRTVIKTFRMVYVDYQSQRRVPKKLFHWYKQVIRVACMFRGRIAVAINESRRADQALLASLLFDARERIVRLLSDMRRRSGSGGARLRWPGAASGVASAGRATEQLPHRPTALKLHANAVYGCA